MSQFRQNPISKHWVLIAPNRAKRPEQFASEPVMHDSLQEISADCPFCPGNENLNPEIGKVPNNKNWQVRIIPNKFEALTHVPFQAMHGGFFEARSGAGDHEVIITRKHNEPVALQSIQTVELTLKVFRQRIIELGQGQHLSYVQIFHNHGRDAGASLIHPHHQIISLPMVPSNVHDEILGCFHYFQETGRNIYADLIEAEKKAGQRVIFESQDFIVVAPWASRNPFETWILPKFDSGRYEDITDLQVKQLSYVLKVTLGQLYIKLSDPALNFYIHTMPLKHVHHMAYNEKVYRWHLTIFPRTTLWAGFDYSTGIPINIMPPEEAATFLR